MRSLVTVVVGALVGLSSVACDVPTFGGRGPVPPTAVPTAPPTAQPVIQVVASPTAAPVVRSSPDRPSDVITRVYREGSPAVVSVLSTVVTGGFFNQAQPQPSGAGSGFVISDEGFIVTNNHVVEDADRLEVTLSNGRTVPAKLIGRDPRSDLAVVKVDVPKEQLSVARLGSSAQLEVGEPAIAIGNPFGLDRTVTAGIISGRRPVLDEPAGGANGRATEPGLLIDAIQTDASINPGNSGGPLFNARGEVIGINTLILSPGSQGGQGGNIGIGFAIPIDYARRIVPELMSKGKYSHPFLGLGTQEITETIAQQASLPVKEGLLVAEVDASGPAAKAGIRAGTRPQDARSRQVSLGGDIVVAVDGQPMRRPEELLVYLEIQKRVGDPLTLNLLRDGQRREVTVQLADRPAR